MQGVSRPTEEKRPLPLGFLKYLLVLIILPYCLRGFYIVPAGSGNVFRLGEVSSVADQGINFKIPVIDLVTIVNTEQISGLIRVQDCEPRSAGNFYGSP